MTAVLGHRGTRGLGFRFQAVLLAGALIALGVAGVRGARAAVAVPTVSGPITGGVHGHALFDSWFNLAEVGYEEAEYFVSGTAKDIPGVKSAAYTTRIMVTRPSDPQRFNGTVLLDWVNVTAQFENAVDSLEAQQMLLREGYAIVWVSAQSAGVCCSPLTPKTWDPVRYASLNHPGDLYAQDIFSQVAKSMRSSNGADPMAGLHIERVLASGQSQSASMLYTYVTQVQANAGVIDGFLIHGGGNKSYTTPPSAPVLHLFSDNEASPADPNTTTNYRLWEIAGTAHSDFWLGYHSVFGQGPRTLADAPKQPASAARDLDVIAGNYGEQVHPMQGTCVLAGSTMPMHYAASAAIHALDQWVRTGVAPPSGPRFQFDATGKLAHDVNQNALGGIRLPPIDVPVASYVSTACPLGGVTVPLSDVQLRLRYPTHAEYYTQMTARTNVAVASGWMLADDGADLLTRACAAKVRWGDTDGGSCA